MPEASITQDRSTFFDRLVDEYRFGSPADKLMTWVGLASIPLGAGATKGVVNAQKGLAGILKNYSPKVVNESGYVRELGREIAEEIATNNAPEARSSEIAQNAILNEGNGLVDLGHGNYTEILPDGSTARYTGLAGKDLQEARQDVRDNPYKEDNPYILGMARMTKNALEGINMYPPKISPETQAMIDRINTIINGTPTNNSVGIGPRG